jgi:hypothetical protein
MNRKLALALFKVSLLTAYVSRWAFDAGCFLAGRKS